MAILTEPIVMSLLVYLGAGAVVGWVHLAICGNCNSKIFDRADVMVYMALSALFAIPVVVVSAILSIWDPCGDPNENGTD